MCLSAVIRTKAVWSCSLVICLSDQESVNAQLIRTPGQGSSRRAGSLPPPLLPPSFPLPSSWPFLLPFSSLPLPSPPALLPPVHPLPFSYFSLLLTSLPQPTHPAFSLLFRCSSVLGFSLLLPPAFHSSPPPSSPSVFPRTSFPFTAHCSEIAVQ